MAGLAFGSEPAFVVIVFSVTRDAVPFQFLFVKGSGVTGLAFQGSVPSLQGKPGGFSVVEAGLFPIIRGVTGPAFFPELPAMVIIETVAGNAG